MKNKLLLIICIISLLLLSNSLIAAEKDRIAILSFDAQNCPKATAKIVTDMVSTKIFETRVFTIVEREQINQVFKELELQMTGCTDSACAVKVGQLLSANKIIIGSVYKVDRYIVVLKVVNVANNKIEGNYRAEALKETDLESAVLDIVDKLKYDFKTDMYYSIAISVGYQFAVGDLADLTGSGYGVSLNFYINNFLYKSTILTLTTGAYLFSGKKKSVDSMLAIPALAYIGYSVNAFRNTKIIPSIGGGYYIYSMKYDPDNADVYGKYEYKRETFYDPAISIKTELDYAFTSTIHAFLEPSYTIAFEKKHNPQIAGLNAGIKMFL